MTDVPKPPRDTPANLKPGSGATRTVTGSHPIP